MECYAILGEAGGKVVDDKHDLLPQKCEFRWVNLQLITANEENISAIQALAGSIWNDHYPKIIGQQQVDYMLQRFYSTEAMGKQMHDGQQFFLIEVEGVLEGFLAIEDRGEGQFFLNKFYINTQAQGRGLGEEVWRKFLGMEPHLREVRLQVNRQNFKAINFYFKLGFVIERVADFDIGDGYFMNDFVMRFRS
jgi:ribosomal protein S18 acetylase RimI-like enzyme